MLYSMQHFGWERRVGPAWADMRRLTVGVVSGWVEAWVKFGLGAVAWSVHCRKSYQSQTPKNELQQRMKHEILAKNKPNNCPFILSWRRGFSTTSPPPPPPPWL